ncbi:MAG TPA: GNAT family N-acetyltransferase [Xanthobacteraceae bacterium]|nr:GNAT family N-acetyltransferase [Xanthobacteraceae bacterium]
MSDRTLSIRDPLAADEAAWRALWADYNAFYEVSVPESVTARTWQRIIDPASPIFGRLAMADACVAGFSACVLHEGTWVIAPVCYLEDLFVAPQFRGRGLGRMLITDIVRRAKARGWSRLYWHTRQGNPARRLYDEFAKADDFVRYRLML